MGSGRTEKAGSRAQSGGVDRPGHERSDVFVPGIVAFLAFLAFGAVVIHVGLWGWLKALNGPPVVDAGRPALPRGTNAFGSNGPSLQVNPREDWRAFREREDKLLNSYGWVNRTAGIARVPIEAAIEKVVSEGIPNWGPTNRPISPLELQHQRAKEHE